MLGYFSITYALILKINLRKYFGRQIFKNLKTVFFHSRLLSSCRFMGCSGQNVDDIYKFSSLTDRLEILENTLQWRHMLPTSPDTLS